MNQRLVTFAICVLFHPCAGTAQPTTDPVLEGFKRVEVASVADAMEQLYGQRAYLAHYMRPVFTTKFAGPVVRCC